MKVRQPMQCLYFVILLYISTFRLRFTSQQGARELVHEMKSPNQLVSPEPACVENIWKCIKVSLYKVGGSETPWRRRRIEIPWRRVDKTMNQMMHFTDSNTLSHLFD